jgi:hypothetical protein
MIALLSIVSGRVCLAWMIMAGSGMAGAQPWQPRDLEPPPELPAATGLTRADEAARQPNRRDRAHRLRALRRLQPNSNRTSEAATLRRLSPAFHSGASLGSTAASLWPDD